FFFFSSRRRHTRWPRDWSSDVCSSDLMNIVRRTLDIDADTDARLREMADERGEDVAAVLAEAVALLDSVVDISGPDIGEDRRRRSEERRVGKEWRSGGGGGSWIRSEGM